MDLILKVVVVVGGVKVGKVFQKALKKQRFCVVVFPLHKVLAIFRGFFRTRREKKEQKNSKKKKKIPYHLLFVGTRF